MADSTTSTQKDTPAVEVRPPHQPVSNTGSQQTHNWNIQRGALLIDNRTKRNDNDPLFGHFVDVVDGDHKGLYGVYKETLEADKDGYPTRILVEGRDDRVDLYVVDYKDARAATAGKR